MDNIIKGIVFALVGWACFVGSDSFVKLLNEQGISLVYIVLLGSFSGVIVSMFFVRKKDWHDLKNAFKTTPFLISFLALFTANSSYSSISAFSKLPMPDIYVFIFTAPVVTFFIAKLFLSEKIPLSRWLVAFFCFLGVVIAYIGDLKFGDSHLDPEGLLWVVNLVISVAALNVIMRKLSLSAALMSAFPSAFVTIFFVSFWQVDLFDFFQKTADLWYFSIPMMLCCGLGKISRSQSCRLAPASVIAVTHYSQLPLGVVAGYFLWSNLPSISMIIGGLIIVFCGLFLIWNNK